MRPYRSLKLTIFRASGLSEKKLTLIFAECVKLWRRREEIERIIVGSKNDTAGYRASAYRSDGGFVGLRDFIFKGESRIVRVCERNHKPSKRFSRCSPTLLAPANGPEAKN